MRNDFNWKEVDRKLPTRIMSVRLFVCLGPVLVVNRVLLFVEGDRIRFDRVCACWSGDLRRQPSRRAALTDYQKWVTFGPFACERSVAAVAGRQVSPFYFISWYCTTLLFYAGARGSQKA